MTTSHIIRMAKRAAKDSFFLGSLLEEHRTRHALEFQQLAAQLEITEEKLAELYLCRNLDPSSNEFASQVDTIADAVGCNNLEFLKILREESALAQLRKPTVNFYSGPTIAARDQKADLEPPDDEPTNE